MDEDQQPSALGCTAIEEHRANERAVLDVEARLRAPVSSIAPARSAMGMAETS
jgi:hypothetical protein